MLVLAHLADVEGTFRWLGDRLASASAGRPESGVVRVWLRHPMADGATSRARPANRREATDQITAIPARFDQPTWHSGA
ncbi:MAG: hypothetical protein ABIZ05_01725 [Pseudonocardiaceae bacterium]